jgi:hypothetical protein
MRAILPPVDCRQCGQTFQRKHRAQFLCGNACGHRWRAAKWARGEHPAIQKLRVRRLDRVRQALGREFEELSIREIAVFKWAWKHGYQHGYAKGRYLSRRASTAVAA